MSETATIEATEEAPVFELGDLVIVPGDIDGVYFGQAVVAEVIGVGETFLGEPAVDVAEAVQREGRRYRLDQIVPVKRITKIGVRVP